MDEVSQATMEASFDDDRRNIVSTLFHPRRDTFNRNIRVRQCELYQFNLKADLLRTPKQECEGPA